VVNEAEMVFTELLKCDRLSLYLKKGLPVKKEAFSLAASILRRRITGEPLHYILGKTEFMGFEFRVTAGVFIPRLETEILVEKVVEWALRVRPHESRIKILDIGTGSGCIAVSLAKLLPYAEITAVDISEKAIAVAGHNARIHGVAEKIKFLCGDLSRGLVAGYDIIVSNPPYIPTGEIKRLSPEVREEPRIALDGGKDGLDFYRKIASHVPARLTENGLLIVEIGFSQALKVETLFGASRKLKILEVIPDYNSIERVVVAQKHNNF
jgi:release factor glutamine methyltransferase